MRLFFSRLFKYLLVFAILGGWLFSSWPQIFNFPPGVNKAGALDTANGDGLIIYGVSGNTTPQWRKYASSTNSYGAETATVAGSTGNTFILKTSPTKQEAIAGYVTSGGTLQVICYDGTSWTNEWSVTVGGTATTRRFDIAYETNSGDSLVAYGNNGANMGYRTKLGTTGCGTSNWSTASTFTPVRTTGTISWVRLEASPISTSNTIFVAWEDSIGVLSAQSWSGTAWNSDEPAAAFSTLIERVTTAGDSLSFDIAIESQTGNAIIVFSPNNSSANSCTAGTNCAEYSRYTTSWSTVAAVPTVADPLTNVDLASNPNSNEMVFAGIDNNSADLSLAYWSGSAWTGKANQDTSSASPVAGSKLVACGWLTSGAITRSVCTYNDSGTTNVGWVVGNGGTFTTQTDFTPTPSFGSPQKWYNIQPDPINKDSLMFTLSDTNSDLFAKRLVMDATPTFTWTNADGSAALNTTLAQATVGDFHFAYWRFIPTPTFAQSAYRLFNNADSTDVGTALAAQDTAGTLGSTGASFRLRMLLHIGANQLLASAQQFKLQFAQQSGTCDTAFSGETYADVTAATVIAYKDNATPADGATLTANANDPTHGADTIVNQTYEELNNFTNSVAAISSGQDGEWDFSLKDNGATASTAYCFRAVKSDGTVLDTYTVIPQITTAAAGSLSVDIVDGSGNSVASPAVTFSAATFSFSPATTTATFGTSSEKIRVSNTTGTASWTLTAAATSTQAVWYGGSAGTYDYNDPAYSQDGPDADSVGGRLSVDPSGGTITPQSGCTTTGLSTGSATAFSEGVIDSVTLLSAGGTANTGCFWDFTGIALTQSLPARQAVGTYNFQLVLTVN